MRRENLTGKRFDRLLVQKLASINPPMWQCLCNCQQLINVRSGDLLRGNTTSCGCKKKEYYKSHALLKDLTGQIFGRLTVLSLSHFEKYETFWNCECVCNNLKLVKGCNLRRGHTKSCGCLDIEVRKDRIGDKNNKWNPNLTDEEREKQKKHRRPYNSKYKEWRRSVLLKDNYTCQISGLKNKKFRVHHVASWACNSELRYEISNGITLCKEIHDLFHHIYGRKCNNRLEIENFLQRYKNKEFNSQLPEEFQSK